jgi:inositol phosphorylceramide mannosyltransferase catalytic subunit
MSLIEKHIFQTHKSHNYITSKPKLIECIKSWMIHKNNFKYCFYDNQTCDNFIKNKFDEKTYQAFSMLPINVMKADLWRYCIIYYYGGIYADADTICKINPDIFINNSLLTIVPENDVHLCQFVFSAPKKSPILKTIIDLSVERILTTPIKGQHIIHYLTGPGVFTDGIEKYLLENNKPIFSNKKKYFNYPDPILKVFDYDTFHTNSILHLFTGQDEDGWCKERDKLLC